MLDPARNAEFIDLRICEDAGPDQEAHPLGIVERELPAAARHYVEEKLGVFPVLELAAAHVKRLAVDLSELHIGVADHEFPARVAHRGAAVAAAPRLMEHQQPVLFAQDADEVDGEVCGFDLFGWIGHASPRFRRSQASSGCS